MQSNNIIYTEGYIYMKKSKVKKIPVILAAVMLAANFNIIKASEISADDSDSMIITGLDDVTAYAEADTADAGEIIEDDEPSGVIQASEGIVAGAGVVDGILGIMDDATEIVLSAMRRYTRCFDQREAKDAELRDAGCGLFSLANAVYSFTGEVMDMQALKKWANSVGAWTPESGLYRYVYFKELNNSEFAKTYNFQVSEFKGEGKLADNKTAIRNALTTGNSAVIIGVPNHYMTLTDYNAENNEYYVLESYTDKNRGLESASWVPESKLCTGYTEALRYAVITFGKAPETVKTGTPDAVNIEDGNYQLVNVKTGYYMNYAWGWNSKYKAVIASKSDGSTEQKFRIRQSENLKYVLDILHKDGGVVNSDVDGKAVSGTPLTRWSGVVDDTQKFYFCKGEGDYYYIASATNKNAVLTSPSSVDSQITYTDYNGSEAQQWKLVKVKDSASSTVNPASNGYVKGIDVSVYQGTIDWTKVASSGIDFAIIRSATTNIKDATYKQDANFESNYKNASKTNLKLGSYIYTSANSKDEMKSNINQLLKTLSGKSFDLPVYLDLEAADRQTSLGKTKFTEVVSYGCSLLKNAGYKPGIYASESWLKYYLDTDSLRKQGVDIWMAKWPSQTKVIGPEGYNYSSVCSIWQYACVGKVSGISTDVDLDVRYVVPENTKATVKVNFYRNTSDSDETVVSETFTEGVANQKFGYKPDGTGRYSTMNDPDVGFGKWYREGYKLLGWSFDKDAKEAKYGTYSPVSNSWITNNAPDTSLYAVWEPIEEPSVSDLPEKNDEVKCGDVNGNGIVDITDLSNLALALVGDKVLTAEQQKQADVTGDGKVMLNDLARLRQFLSKVIETL